MILVLFSISLISKEGARDFYQILGIKHDCTNKEIEHSYRVLSKKYHPDKNKGDPQAIEKFNDINDAYGVLRDYNKRRVYDLWGERGVHIYEAPKNTEHFNPITIAGQNTQEDDSFNQIRNKGKTIRVYFPVDLIDFHTGKSYPLHITRRTMCRCPEAGFSCEKCRGRPTVQENITLNLVVEKGTQEGTVVLFEGAGDVSEINSPGDVEAVIISRKDPIYKRDGNNLHMDLKITLRESLLGFKKEIQHFDGTKLIIESKNITRPSNIIIIPNKGLAKYLYPGEFGDLIVHPKIAWPKSIESSKKADFISALSK